MMEQVNFGYSMKCIGIPGKQEYILRLTHSVTKFCNSLRWRAFFFLNPEEAPATKERYGFKSLTPAPGIDQMKEFQDKLVDLIQKVETKKVKNDFQEKLKNDAEKLRGEKKMFIGGDKSTNFYKLDKDSHETLLKKNVTKDYKKTNRKR